VPQFAVACPECDCSIPSMLEFLSHMIVAHDWGGEQSRRHWDGAQAVRASITNADEN